MCNGHCQELGILLLLKKSPEVRQRVLTGIKPRVTSDGNKPRATSMQGEQILYSRTHARERETHTVSAPPMQAYQPRNASAPAKEMQVHKPSNPSHRCCLATTPMLWLRGSPCRIFALRMAVLNLPLNSVIACTKSLAQASDRREAES